MVWWGMLSLMQQRIVNSTNFGSIFVLSNIDTYSIIHSLVSVAGIRSVKPMCCLCGEGFHHCFTEVPGNNYLLKVMQAYLWSCKNSDRRKLVVDGKYCSISEDETNYRLG